VTTETLATSIPATAMPLVQEHSVQEELVQEEVSGSQSLAAHRRGQTQRDLRALADSQALVPMAAPAPVRRKATQPVPLHISGTDVPDCTCQLVGVDAGFLYVRSDRQIPEASSIVVSFDHIQVSGVVAGCQPAINEWLISVALSSSKRRLDDRIPNGEDGVVGIIGHEGAILRPCRIVDTSAFGMGIRLAFPINPGSRVCVEAGSTMIFGEVRHCNPVRRGNPASHGEFVAGILVVDVVQDVRTESKLSLVLNNLRWKLASSIRGKDVPAYRPDW